MVSIRKTIALNTIYLYLGSFFQLIVGLYTSRALLQALGVEDFGIYGVVGGIIGLLSFINMAMGSASSRYITYELANGTIESQRRIFSVVFTVHIVIASLTFVLGETVGLWYVYNKLVVPDGRINAAHWVYQAAIFMSIINIIQVPYTASITAHEKMGFLSFWNSLNIFLKLIVIILLYLVKTDELVFYAFLMSVTTLFIGIGYFIYCKFSFKECTLERVTNKHLFKEVLSFAGFSAFTSFANALRTQGTSLLINRFFGVTLNAAGSVASLISGYIISFTSNIITAFSPQIVKTYAVKDYNKMSSYIKQCMNYSLGLFSILAVPIFLEMNYALSLWLGKVPQYATEFCQISLVGALFGLLNMTALIAVQATAHVKKNSLYISITSLISVLFLYFLFMIGLKPYMAYFIYSITEFLIFSISVWNVKRLIPQVEMVSILFGISKTIFIITVSVVIVWGITNTLSFSIFRFLLVISIYTLVFGTLFSLLSLTKEERQYLYTNLRSKFN